MTLTREQVDRISRIGEQWSLLWDKRQRLWIAAEDAEDGEQIEEADLDVLLDRLVSTVDDRPDEPEPAEVMLADEPVRRFPFARVPDITDG